MDNSRRMVFIVIFAIAISMLLLVVSKSHRHSDIVIKTATHEFIVDDYYQDDNCIEFNYGGELRTICGDYEIIE
jgi:hypothetical protein